MSAEVNLKKGMRVRAEWFHANNPPSSLAGMQLKFGAQVRSLTGTVRHIRADGPDPEHAAMVRIFVQPDDGSGEPCAKCHVNEVAVDPKWIVEVLAP